jgi:ubiquinol-cytochrome c reductase cytochrome c subunit
LSIECFVQTLTFCTFRCVPFAFLIAFLFQGSRGECSDTDSIARGEQIFSQQCARCHGIHGEGKTGNAAVAGPSLRAEHNHGQVMTAIEVGPSPMPSFVHVLSVAEIRDVSHYVADRIAVIPLDNGDLATGGVLYRSYCASCHRTAGRGGTLAYVGTNAPSIVDMSAARIAGAIRWGPGPMPSFSASLLDDAQVASVVDYVRGLQNLPTAGGISLWWYGPVPEGFVAWCTIAGLIIVTSWIEKGGRG